MDNRECKEHNRRTEIVEAASDMQPTQNVEGRTSGGVDAELAVGRDDGVGSLMVRRNRLPWLWANCPLTKRRT
jgi:hypothetical protein